MTKNERNTYIDVIKGYAIFLVAYCHSMQCLNPEWMNTLVGRSIISFHMPLFIFVSGYFFYDSVHRCDCVDFIKKRFARLMLPSLFWGLFNVLLIGGSKLQSGKELEVLYFFNLFITGMWFLTVLFWLSVFGAFISRFCKRELICWIFLYLMIYVCPPLYVVNEIKFLMPFFVSAIYLRKICLERINWKLFVLALAIFVYSLSFYTFEKSLYMMDADIFTWDYLANTLLRIVIGFSGIVLSLFVCKWIAKLSWLKSTLLYMGGVTLPIYVLHEKFLMANKVLRIESSNHIVVLILTVLIILASIQMYTLLKKTRFCSMMMFGERNT